MSLIMHTISSLLFFLSLFSCSISLGTSVSSSDMKGASTSDVSLNISTTSDL